MPEGIWKRAPRRLGTGISINDLPLAVVEAEPVQPRMDDGIRIRTKSSRREPDLLKDTEGKFNDQEVIPFRDWVNATLAYDRDLSSVPYFPITSSRPLNFFRAFETGILMCKLIEWASPGTIKGRLMKKRVKLNRFEMLENHELAIRSAVAIGCNTINVGPEDLLRGQPNLVMGLLWQIIRVGLFSQIQLSQLTELQDDPSDGKGMIDPKQLAPETILIRWVNHQLHAAGHPRRIKNFSDDIRDSVVYSVLLKQIAPEEYRLDQPHLDECDLSVRAKRCLDNAKKLNCCVFLTPQCILDGNARMNTAFVCNLFNTFPGFSAADHAVTQCTSDRSVVGSREQSLLVWVNSFGVSPMLRTITNDLRDGWILMQVMASVAADGWQVDLSAANRPTQRRRRDARWRAIENCNRVIEIAHKLRVPIVGIGAEDVVDGNEKLTTAFLWQLMRTHTKRQLQLPGQREPCEQQLTCWVNEQLSLRNKSSRIDGLSDPIIGYGVVVIDILDCLRPRLINYDVVRRTTDNTSRLLNAKYAISMARRLGMKVFLTANDIVDIRRPMIASFFFAMMAWQRQQRNETTQSIH